LLRESENDLTYDNLKINLENTILSK